MIITLQMHYDGGMRGPVLARGIPLSAQTSVWTKPGLRGLLQQLQWQKLQSKHCQKDARLLNLHWFLSIFNVGTQNKSSKLNVDKIVHPLFN